MIRASLYSGTPLGNECFKKKIEVMTGCKVGEILDDMRPKVQGSYKDQLNVIEDRAGQSN